MPSGGLPGIDRGLRDGIIGADGPPAHESDASAVLPVSFYRGKLPSVGIVNESSTNGPGAAGFGRVTPEIQQRRDGRLAKAKGGKRK